MVQRLALLGLVSEEELPMVLSTLAAISGMQPRRMKELREIWEPRVRYTPDRYAATNGQGPSKASQIEQYRIFVARDKARSDKPSVKIEIDEVPEAGLNIKVISQTVLEAAVLSNIDDVPKFLDDLGYALKKEFITAGFEYILNSQLVVHVFRIEGPDGKQTDDSRQWVTHVFVDVESVTDLRAVEEATQMLLNAQQELRSVVTLRTPNRASFNTRMPRVQQ